MAIVESEGRPNDVPDTVWDLVEGFTILARGLAGRMEDRHVRSIVPIIERLHRRASRLDRENLADQLADARDHLQAGL